MTTAIPRSLIESAPPARRACTERWWSALDEATRRELVQLDDPTRDDIARTATEDPSRWAELPLELHGHFVDPEDARDDAMWRQDFIEYLNAHPEIDFFLHERRFHICRAHADARRLLETGRIPHDFACPLARAACPFAVALREQPGRAIVLSLRRERDARGARAPLRAHPPTTVVDRHSNERTFSSPKASESAPR